MLDDFLEGGRCALRGLGMLNTRGLRRYVAIPLAINTLLFAALIGWGAVSFDAWVDRMLGGLPAWLEWLSWLLWPLFVLTVLVVVFYAFSLVGNLIASPFNSLLAERAESLLTPNSPPPESRPLWQEIAVAPLEELKKLGYFLLWIIPLLILFLIPGLNTLAPLLWVVFGAWMLSLEYLDYPMGNHAIAFRDQRARVAGKKPMALGFGAVVLLLTAIPIVNFLVIPASVIGATELWVREFKSGSRV